MGSRRLYHVALQALAEKLWRQSGHRCGICAVPMLRSDLPSAHIDHVIPWSLGGTDDLENLRVAHPGCNIRRGNDLTWHERHPKVNVSCVECGVTFMGLRGVSRYCTPAHQNAAAVKRFRDLRKTPKLTPDTLPPSPESPASAGGV